ncbi:Asparagine synthetase domain-containing protein 1 [Cyanidiococcus yangmingshanensis]|uniref:Asparagine synthetase domain-containing protein 1 n=1 Tax=Cyanidiococcus yangmingshanensis TaxID=2690220 RepID=A0A7J7ICS8_9RHOD|nr:Asparagine synthetase domain-containing protein 1 [Cyanidiococcus yangmingshanensis]
MCGIAALLTWPQTGVLVCRTDRARDGAPNPGHQSLQAWWRALSSKSPSDEITLGKPSSVSERSSTNDSTRQQVDALWVRCCEHIRNRGPDAYAEYSERLHNASGEKAATELVLASSTLAIRDHDPACKQPALSASGRFVVAYNGELYGSIACDTAPVGHHLVWSQATPVCGNDLGWICRELEVSASMRSSEGWHPGLVLRRCAGPYALLIWDRQQQRLYFGRDALGRRSLLMATDPAVGLILCSVVPAQGTTNQWAGPQLGWTFRDVPPLGGQWYVIDTARLVLDLASERSDQLRFGRSAYRARGMPQWLHQIPPWIWIPLRLGEQYKRLEWDAPADIGTCRLAELRTPSRLALATDLGRLICGIVQRQVDARRSHEPRPALGVLFSGGIDSLIVARALDLVLAPDESIHLIHVSFSADVVDGSTKQQHPTRLFATASTTQEGVTSGEGAGDGESLAITSMQTSVLNGSLAPVPAFASLAVDSDSAPDTLQAYKALEMLDRLSLRPGRFRFRHARVRVTDVQRDWPALKAVIEPAETTPMDIALGACLWYAARAAAGNTDLRHCSEPVPILFSGLGADELFAGYKGRHRSRFQRGGMDALFHELEADLNQLWWRNLGRDDRCVADHGCELRHPFLDESLIEWLRQVIGSDSPAATSNGSANPLGKLCDLRLPDGIGDKLILRLAATVSPLSIDDELAETPKRAMQFGTRACSVLERRCHQVFNAKPGSDAHS